MDVPCYVKMQYYQERAEYVNANVPIRNQVGPLECVVRKEAWQLVVVAQDLFVMLSNRCAVNNQSFLTYVNSDDVRQKGDA